MYTVIGPVRSRAFRVLWMLEELGVPYTHRPYPPRSAEVRAFNPSGKVPVLLADDAPLTDSVAIMTHLADSHGALTAPAGTLDRARQDAMTLRLLDEFDSALWTAARHSFVLPEERRVPAVKDSLRWEFGENLAALAQDFGDGPFLMGEAMRVPDIVLTHCLGWARVARFPDAPEPLPAYLKRMRARPAYQRAQAAA